MVIPDGYKIEHEGKYYAQIVGIDRHLTIAQADDLYEQGYKVIEIKLEPPALFVRSTFICTVTLFKWREAAKCGS